jgi:predicted dehydrogenase
MAAIATGKLGRVHYATSSRLNLGLHRRDANVIWDLGPHDVSIVLHLLNEQPEVVQTTAQCITRRHLPDVAFMNLRFPSGAIAAIDVSWLAPRKIRSTTLVGERSMMVWDDTQLDEPVKIYDKGVVTSDPDSDNFGEHQLTYRVGDTISPYVGNQEPLAQELEHFLRCIREGRAVRSDGRFGLQVVDVLEAADRSWRLGGVPVEVGEPAHEVRGLATASV